MTMNRFCKYVINNIMKVRALYVVYFFSSVCKHEFWNAYVTIGIISTVFQLKQDLVFAIFISLIILIY